jgi:Type II secretory pathway, prepilin signal peptidase PulO and related peptidases
MDGSSLPGLLAAHPAWLALAMLVLGLLFGSFLNVIILRLPKMMEARWRAECREFLGQAGGEDDNATATSFNIAYPASHCPSCGHELRWWENLPLLSYALLRGRCSSCKTRISPQYPLVEAAAAGLAVLAALYAPVGWPLVFALVFVWALLTLAVIDLNTMLLPDQITLPLLWLGLLVNLGGTFASLPDAIIGAAAGYLVLWAVYQAFRLLTGKEGMGYGDFKLLAALGAWMGWQALPGIVLFSSLVGAIVGIGMMALRKQDRSAAIPFGPYLAAAGLIWFFWGEVIAAAYLGGPGR